MTKHTHTPGPWRLIQDGPMPDSRSICAGDYGIGEVWNLNGNPENLANAHLIAAAPDMLAALERCEQILSNCIVAGEALADHFPTRLAAVRAAIAKAKGE